MEFVCKECDYKTPWQNNYIRHVTSTRHLEKIRSSMGGATKEAKLNDEMINNQEIYNCVNELEISKLKEKLLIQEIEYLQKQMQDKSELLTQKNDFLQKQLQEKDMLMMQEIRHLQQQ